jgi:hypothetical protein
MCGSKQNTSPSIHHSPCHAQLSKVLKLTSPKESQQEYPKKTTFVLTMLCPSFLDMPITTQINAK